MKKLLLFLFIISFHGHAQDTIPAVRSVIALDKMNVVYRGVQNPISIAVNNAKSYVIYGNGVSKKEDGKYVIKPGSGNETKVFVEIENFDGSKVVEEHVFRIKGLPAIVSTVNGINTYILLKRDNILKAIVSTEMEDFIFVDKTSDFFKVNSFEIKFSNGKILQIEGNTFTKVAYNEIIKLKKGEVFEIISIDYGPEMDGLKRKVFPIQVILAD